MNSRALVVDDDTEMVSMLEVGLSSCGIQVTPCTTGRAALDEIAAHEFDVVVTDLNMRGMSGIELCEHICASRPNLPVVVITAFGSLDTAVGALRAGAYDFIAKPFQLDVLRLTLERAVRHRALRNELKVLRSALSTTRRFEELLGNSPAMRRVYDTLTRIGDADASVLVTGESGTGKELVARALHHCSRRSRGPFVAVNCAAVPEALLESELFGHARGAFTDAKAAKDGLFLQANGGTLLLDEIAELPLGLQPKLLRALQERTVRPVGADREIPFDVRLVTATNRDLESAVEERRFREDLFYRVNVIHVALPPLRDRGNDVLLLAQHFLERLGGPKAGLTGISAGAAARLLAYSWPGNVRELHNCMERAVALARFSEITVEDLPERVRDYTPARIIPEGDEPLVTMEEMERRYLLRVLDGAGGNKTLAAQILGLDRATLYRKLERYLRLKPADV
ncbi:MAG TPA: sigma-54 dependent transcriptional regulator [Myxococcales bacterium]|nr:sigma-54 dependent transcriptional regulator [Myxococcales bacterium]